MYIVQIMDNLEAQICSQSKCKKQLPSKDKYKYQQCERCCETNRILHAQMRKRKREGKEPPCRPPPPTPGSTCKNPLTISSGSESEDGNSYVSLVSHQ